jgi:hypothetical protein
VLSVVEIIDTTIAIGVEAPNLSDTVAFIKKEAPHKEWAMPCQG